MTESFLDHGKHLQVTKIPPMVKEREWYHQEFHQQLRSSTGRFESMDGKNHDPNGDLVMLTFLWTILRYGSGEVLSCIIVHTICSPCVHIEIWIKMNFFQLHCILNLLWWRYRRQPLLKLVWRRWREGIGGGRETSASKGRAGWKAEK